MPLVKRRAYPFHVYLSLLLVEPQMNSDYRPASSHANIYTPKIITYSQERDNSSITHSSIPETISVPKCRVDTEGKFNSVTAECSLDLDELSGSFVHTDQNHSQLSDVHTPLRLHK